MRPLSANAACPRCGLKDEVIPIIYSCSVPDYESYRRLEKEGRVLLAGCVVSVDTPKFFCKRCRQNIWEEDL